MRGEPAVGRMELLWKHQQRESSDDDDLLIYAHENNETKDEKKVVSILLSKGARVYIETNYMMR
jgi:hypothetical protein